MSDFMVPGSFFAEVAGDLWRKAPRVWRRPFATPYGTDADVFRALCALTGRLDSGDTSIHPRVFVDDRKVGFSLDRHAARPIDGDLAGFERRLLTAVAAEPAGQGAVAGTEVGMVIGDAVALDPVLWRNAQSFLRGLYAAVGTPPGGAHAEIFFGNYQRSFFGLHKDRLETFTFVIRGRKRFLAWPYEALRHLPDVPEKGELHAFNFEKADLDALLPTAVVLEGEPGDVMFWPAGWWHVAESADPGFAWTLTLACAPSTMLAAGSPLRLAQEGFDEAGKDGYYTEDPSFPVGDAKAGVAAVESALAAVLTDPVFVKARRAATLQWLSTLGFKRGPERGPIVPLQDGDLLTSQAPILYDEVDEDGFPCATNGIILTTLPAYLPLIDRLNGGGTFRVGALVAEHADGPGQPSADDLREALSHLVAAHALRRG